MGSFFSEGSIPMAPRSSPVHLAFLLTPLLMPLLAACSHDSVPDPRTQPPLVETVAVRAAVNDGRAFSGVVGARVQSELGFRVGGKVLQRLVDVGQTVRQGQPLMRIDPVDLGLQAHAQDEAVAAARARARQAGDDEARYRDLVAAGAVSASAYEQLKAAAETARAQLSAAQAQAAVARNASNYAVRLAHAGAREAVIALPETLRPAIGSRAQASLYGTGAAIGNARLRQLADAADRNTRTYEARYVLEGPLAAAPLGATVTLRLDAGEQGADQVQVPAAAVFDGGKGAGVWTVAGQPGKVTWRPVQVRAIGDESVRVTGALKPGEQVVALGAHLLHEGEAVRVADGAAPRQLAAAGGSVK